MIPGGGGQGANDIGQPGKTFHVRQFDDLTRRMTRSDMMKFVSDPNNLSEHEQGILTKMMYYGAGGSTLAGGLGFYVSRFLPWRYFNGDALPFKNFITVGRVGIGFAFASVPFVIAQKWGLEQILSLPEESRLAFMTRRFLMTQRGNVLFTRSEVQEITKDELKRRGAVGGMDPRNAVMQAQAPEGGINADYTLSQQQQLVPIAQTGYKPPPPK